jgi:hypothetical protein
MATKVFIMYLLNYFGKSQEALQKRMAIPDVLDGTGNIVCESIYCD